VLLDARKDDGLGSKRGILISSHRKSRDQEIQDQGGKNRRRYLTWGGGNKDEGDGLP